MMSLIVVGVLCVTGLVNSLFLVGSVSSLSTTDYGRWLVVKVVLFIVMIGLGAMNFKRWKPRLAEANEIDLNDAEAAERWLKREIGDAEAIDDMARKFGQLVDIWLSFDPR